MCNVYRRIVLHFARAAAPLNVQRRKDQSFELTFNAIELNELQEIEERLRCAPVLALSQHEQRYTLDTIACDYRVWYVLSQQQLNKYKLFAGFWSRSFSSLEKNFFSREEIVFLWYGVFLYSDRTCMGKPLHSVRITAR